MAEREAPVSATAQIAAAPVRAGLELAGDERTANELAREGRRALDQWGHGKCELVLERVSEVGDPVLLHCLFWCKGCHVSQ